MKNIIYIFIFFAACHSLEAQKHDNNWVFGNMPARAGLFSFPNNSLQVDSLPFCIIMHASAMTMSDTAGNLLFYTNTYRVANAQHQIMPHGAIAEGDTLNFQYLSQYTSVQTLPHPSDPQRHYLIKQVYDRDAQGYIYAFKLKYCLIDMAADSGRGDVVLKNQTLVDDTLAGMGLSAVRHGNGRDWWIVTPEYGSRNYWVVLLSDSGFTAKKQLVAGPANLKPNIQGSSAFSPDGSLYARYDQTNGGQMHLWRFDRCRGLLYAPLHFDFPKPANTGAYGVCFSPNNRFLYLCHGISLVQFELLAPDIAASAVTLFTGAGNGNTFSQIGLAPDGKIYLRAYPLDLVSDNTKASVINQPDLKGLACDFQPSAINLTSTSRGLVPNYPNYRLGAKDCDTTGVSLLPPALPGNGLRISPNPATDRVDISYTDRYCGQKLEIYDLNGAKVASRLLPHATNRLEITVGNLPAGLYVVKVAGESLKLLVR